MLHLTPTRQGPRETTAPVARQALRVISIAFGVPAGAPLRAVLAALFLVITCALPVAALSSVTLTDAVASPTSGTTSTDITFTVLYRSAIGLRPMTIQVLVADHVYPMHAPSEATGWKKGVRFSVTTHLPGGTWPSELTASDGNGGQASVNGPTITIASDPTPTPRPTPTPTPRPTATPAPTPRPTATPAPTPRPTATPGPTATPAPTPRPTATPGPTATPAPTPRPTATPAPTPRSTATPAPTPRPSTTPAPTPTLTPGPTASTAPGSTPAPSTSPPATPRPTTAPTLAPGDSGSGTGGDTPGSSPDATAGDSGASGLISSAAPDGSPAPTQAPGLAFVVPPGTGPGGTSGSAGTGSGGSGDPGGSANGGPAGGSGSGGLRGSGYGPGGTSLPGGLGGPSAGSFLVRLVPLMLVTTGGVAMAMAAFMAFGRRRRDEATAPVAILAASAASAGGGYARSGLVPDAVLVPDSTALATAVRAAAAPAAAAGPVDADVPRWRRQSLIEARKADPVRTISATVNLTFDGAAGAAVSGLERRRIRYRLVGLLDQPDDVRAVQTGTLDEGDEVVLLEKHGTYWRVLCPDGREGWLHKMVLGAIPEGAQAAAQPGTWTAGDDGPATGTFEDILRIYAERRDQFGEA